MRWQYRWRVNSPPKILTLLLGLTFSSAACSPAPNPASSTQTSSPEPAGATTSSPPRTAEPSATSARPAEPSASPAVSASTPTSDVCAPSGDWESCVNKVARIVGTKATNVMQHPSSGSLPMPGAKPVVEDYVDVDGRQVVVALEKAISCPGKVEIVGLLVAVRLGGAPGTKGSYSGFRFERATARCL